MNEQVVSFDDEPLILVDEKDQICGYKNKIDCHMGEGILHRAFSILIFNKNKELLLQKRSRDKMLWPLTWSNSCCSHPRKGESYKQASERRMLEELGFSTPLTYLYRFQYQAQYKNKGSENELCSVFIGRHDGEVIINQNEIDEWKFISIPDLEHELAIKPGEYTPWFKIEWKRIKEEHLKNLDKLF